MREPFQGRREAVELFNDGSLTFSLVEDGEGGRTRTVASGLPAEEAWKRGRALIEQRTEALQAGGKEPLAFRIREPHVGVIGGVIVDGQSLTYRLEVTTAGEA